MKVLKRNKGFKKFMKGLTRHPLFKNKLYGTGLILIGILGTVFLNDLTILIFSLMFGLPVIFAKKNVITD